MYLALHLGTSLRILPSSGAVRGIIPSNHDMSLGLSFFCVEGFFYFLEVALLRQVKTFGGMGRDNLSWD